MFDKFGEFNSAEELNKTAAGLKAEGDIESLVELAVENGLDKEDAEDYMVGCMEELANPLMAALGKIKVETKELEIKGILEDWKDEIIEMCTNEEEMCAAVRKKEKKLKDCMAKLIAYAFENKVQVSDKIVKATMVKHNGKTEPFKGPLYLGIPNRTEVRILVKKYYLGEGGTNDSI